MTQPLLGCLSLLVENLSTTGLFINEHVDCDGKTINNLMGFSMMLFSAVSECLVEVSFYLQVNLGVKT